MRRNIEKAEVLAAVEQAFSDVHLEDGISANMAEYKEAPWATRASQYLRLAETDERDDWRKVSDSLLEERESIFHFSDPKGFRFYAPAFMHYALRHHEGSKRFIVDGIIYALSPDNNVFKELQFEECFTPEQIAAIMMFLEYCVQQRGTFDGRTAAKVLRSIRQRLGTQSKQSSERERG